VDTVVAIAVATMNIHTGLPDARPASFVDIVRSSLAALASGREL
jgi:hypothetical protein